MRFVLILVASGLCAFTALMAQKHGIPLDSKAFWLNQGAAFGAGAFLALSVFGKWPRKEKK